MRRAQKLVVSAILALTMLMHVASQLARPSPTEASWLSMVDIGVSVLVISGAIALFLKTRGTQTDGLPFLSRDDEARGRSIWRGIGAVVLCLVGTTLLIVLIRLVGIRTAQVSRFLDTTTAVMYPLFGSIVLFGLIRKGPDRSADKAISHL